MKYVRWIGAYAGREYKLADSLTFEINRTDEAACEPIKRRNGSYISGIAPRVSRVGVLLSERSIFRTFRKDCYSYYEKQKRPPKGQEPTVGVRLVAGKMNPHSSHGEAWARMKDAVEAIVIYGSLSELRKEDLAAVEAASKSYNIPIVALTHKGEFVY